MKKLILNDAAYTSAVFLSLLVLAMITASHALYWQRQLKMGVLGQNNISNLTESRLVQTRTF